MRSILPWRPRRFQHGGASSDISGQECCCSNQREQEEKEEEHSNVSSSSSSSPCSENEGEPSTEIILTAESSMTPANVDGDRARSCIGDDTAETSSTNPEENENHGLVDDEETPSERWRRRKLVSIYLITTILLFADMNLLAPNLTDVGDEFGFDSDERDVKIGGEIALAFFLVGAPAAFFVGWLADRVPRRGPLFSATVTFGEAACFATYFTTTFAGLFVCRALTGISIGGALPVIYSVLGDVYRANQRVAVAALISTGTGIGIGVGHGIAGFLGDKYGWRLPFLVVSIPSFLCAFALLFVEEPERGGKEEAKIERDAMRRRAQESVNDLGRQEVLDVGSVQQTKNTTDGGEMNNALPADEDNVSSLVSVDEHIHVPDDSNNDNGPEKQVVCNGNQNGEQESHSNEKNVGDSKHATWKTSKDLFNTPSVTLMLLQAAPGCLPFGVAAQFLNDYLNEDRGMSKSAATGVLLFFGAGNAIGVIFGGVLGHCAYRRNVRYPPLVMGSALILGCIPMWFMINNVNEGTSVSIVGLISVITGILVIVPIPIERAILSNVTIPTSRGLVNSFLGIVDDLGKGLGPYFVSLIIDASSRRTAFNISLLGWLVGGIFSFLIYFFVKEDEDKIQDLVRQALDQEEELQRKQIEEVRCNEEPRVEVLLQEDVE